MSFLSLDSNLNFRADYSQPLDLCTGCLQYFLLIIFHDSTATFSNRPFLRTLSKVISPLTQWPYHFYRQDLFYFIHCISNYRTVRMEECSIIGTFRSSIQAWKLTPVYWSQLAFLFQGNIFRTTPTWKLQCPF